MALDKFYQTYHLKTTAKLCVCFTLKRKCRHFDEILITGCTGSCHFDNFQCSQWWKFHQNEDISVSVYGIYYHKDVEIYPNYWPTWSVLKWVNIFTASFEYIGTVSKMLSNLFQPLLQVTPFAIWMWYLINIYSAIHYKLYTLGRYLAFSLCNITIIN